MPKYSVIVPVYKAEKNLNLCVMSILNQTFSDFELILVDDGSPDNCGTMCDEYARKDHRVKVIHKSNGGVSSARNAGLDKATGNFIVFVDSDDTISCDYLQSFADFDCDVCICSYIRYFETNNTYYTHKETDLIQENITNLYLLELLETKKLFTVWGKFFKRQLIEECNNLRFRSDISYGEDTVFSLTLFNRCKNVAFSEKATYHYNTYKGEQLTSTLTKSMIYSCFECDKFVESWLHDINVKSNFFMSLEYPTKKKLRWAFYIIFEDNQMLLTEKRKWYKLFLSSDVFLKNINIILPEISNGLKFIIKTHSPLLLCIFQYLSAKKSSFINKQ